MPITSSRYDPKFCQPVGCVVSKIEDFRRVLLVRLLIDWDVGRRQAENRKVLSEPLGDDERENLFGDVETWSFNHRKPVRE